MVNTAQLTLADAVKQERLQEFIAQEEARGVGPINRAEFDALLGRAATAPQSKDQTSRSSSADGSTGRRIHQDKRPSAQR